MNSRAGRQSGRRAHSLHKQRGVALLLFLLVLLVASSVFLIRHADSRVSAAQKRLVKSTQALADAKAALIAYAVQDTNRPGSLPCPDVDYDGESRVGIEYIGDDCADLLGWFPYRSLDMQELRDDSGSRLWYAIASEYRANANPTLLGYVPLNSETAGTLTVDALSDVVAVIIAPGVAFDAQSRPDGSATPDAGTHRGEFLEGINADATLEDYVSTSGGDFNDRVMVITRGELMREVEKRVVGEVTGSLQAFRAAHGVFPWPVLYDPNPPTPPENPLFKTNFRGTPGTTEGLLPRHFGDDMTTGFPSTFTVTWSGLANVTLTSLSGSTRVADLIHAPRTMDSGTLVHSAVNVVEVDGTCFWDATLKTAMVRCLGVSTINDMTAIGTEYQSFQPSPPFGPTYSVDSWTRTYTFDLNITSGAASGISAPTLSSPRTRSFTTTSAGAGSQWVVNEVITYNNAGTPVTVTGTGTLDTTSSTVGNLSVSSIYYYLDEDSELPSWFIANDWHHLIYYSVAADYLGGGDGDCVTSASCLALEVAAATPPVANDVGIAVVSAGNAIGGQVRTGGTATLDQYVEDADAANNIFGPVVSYRPRGDAGNNDHVRALRAGAL